MGTGLPTPRVVVVPHDPRWASAFAESAVSIQATLGDNLRELHHIGSTSIPAMPAKPIIDMLAVVADLAAVDAAAPAMQALGYISKGEHGIAGRRFLYRNDAAGTRTHQIHAFAVGSPHIARHLAFRDFVRAHPQIAWQYAELKQMLAKRHPNDLEAYMDGKDPFIKEIERRAMQLIGSGGC